MWLHNWPQSKLIKYLQIISFFLCKPCKKSLAWHARDVLSFENFPASWISGGHSTQFSIDSSDFLVCYLYIFEIPFFLKKKPLKPGAWTQRTFIKRFLNIVAALWPAAAMPENKTKKTPLHCWVTLQFLTSAGIYNDFLILNICLTLRTPQGNLQHAMKMSNNQ